MPQSLFLPVIDNGMGLSRTSWGTCMFELGHALHAHKVTVHQISYPYPDGAMNFATAEFLESKADEMLLIDTDLLFTAGQVQSLLSHNEPLVFGMYPKKELGLTFPLEGLTDVWPFVEGCGPLVEVKRAARGFMRVHREVFEILAESVPYIKHPQTGTHMHLFWQNMLGGHSEDYAFCDLWRKHGGKVLVDSLCALQHEGSAVYPIPGTY